MIQGSLVLEGGAARGVFTSGSLDFLMENSVEFSHVIGVSAGACNASNFLSHQAGRSRDCWIHKNNEHNYYYNLPQILENKSVMDMDMIFNQFPNKFYPFDYETFFNSRMVCEIVVTNCETGMAEYITETQEKNRLMKICRASCSMPLLTPMVSIDECLYLDGGIADSVPIRRAIKYGSTKIVLILTRQKGYRKPYPRKLEIKLLKQRYKDYPNLIKVAATRSIAYNRTMEFIEHLEADGKIFVLRPEMKTVKRMEKDYETLMAFYRHGYRLLEKRFDALKEYLEK